MPLTTTIQKLWIPPYSGKKIAEMVSLPEHMAIYVALACGTTVVLRQKTKPAQGFRLRIPRYAHIDARKRSSEHWQATTDAVVNLGMEHRFYPKNRPVCVRLRDCEELVTIKLASGLPHVEEYLEGTASETPSLLAQWFGFNVPTKWPPG